LLLVSLAQLLLVGLSSLKSKKNERKAHELSHLTSPLRLGKQILPVVTRTGAHWRNEGPRLYPDKAMSPPW
jgi:hypothetical protein